MAANPPHRHDRAAPFDGAASWTHQADGAEKSYFGDLMIGSQRAAGRILLKRASIALLGSASMLAITPALADTAAAPAAPEAANSSEIVVTATKRSENVQNVPISITAFGNATLAQHQVSSFDDYAKMLPSVSYQSFGPGQSQLNFRGITSGGDGSAFGPLPTAGLYLNETPITTLYGAPDVHVYDMDHVEALSGPQGTLYGASSLAGTLRLITAAPKIGKWEGGFDLEGNKFGPGSAGGKVEGYVNMPIGDRAALRVVGFYQHDGGYISNSPASRTYQRATGADVNGNAILAPLTVTNAQYVKKNFNTVDDFGGRAALKVDLDEHWTATPMVIYQHQTANGTYLYNDPNGTGYSAAYVPGYGSLQVHDFTPDHNRDAWYMASMTLQGKISDWDVTYNGSYFGRQADTVADYSYFTVAYDGMSVSNPANYANYTYFTDASGHNIDPTQIFHQHDSYTKMSHEFRVSSPVTNPFRLTAGAFMQRQTDHHTADYEVAGLSNSVQYANWQVPGAPANDVYYTDANRIDRDYAAFIEGTGDISETLSIIGGFRLFNYNNTLSGFSGGQGSLLHTANADNCAVVTVQACPNIVGKQAKQTGQTHKIEAQWKFEPGKMLYAVYSSGFRPGGNNRDAFFQPAGSSNYRELALPPYAADTLNNYEIGWKTSWFGRKLYFNGALFVENWNNMQYSEPGPQGIYYTVNAGTATSQGVEGSLTWHASHGLTISTNATYVDAKLTSDFVNGGVIVAPKGTRLPVTPKFKGNATARYEWMAGSAKAFVQGSVNTQSNVTNYLIPAYESIIGANAGFTTADFSAGISRDKWSISAYVTNAFNEMGVLTKNAVCAPTICGAEARLYPTKPQEFGIHSSYKF